MAQTRPIPSQVPIRTMVLHTSVAFVSAHLVVVLLHEASHVTAGLVLGYSNELFPFGVTHSPAPDRADSAVTALTGPAFSLVIGVLAMAVRPFQRSAGFAHLWWLWFAFMSVMEGVGYLVLTPFHVGDTGSTAEAYDVPAGIEWASFAVGAVLTVVLAKRFGDLAVRHTARDLRSLRSFTFFPWMIGTAVVLVLALIDITLTASEFADGDIAAVMAGVFALGVFAPMAMPFASSRVATGASTTQRMSFDGTPVVGIAVIVVLSALNWVVLAPGLTIG